MTFYLTFFRRYHIIYKTIDDTVTAHVYLVSELDHSYEEFFKY